MLISLWGQINSRWTLCLEIKLSLDIALMIFLLLFHEHLESTSKYDSVSVAKDSVGVSTTPLRLQWVTNIPLLPITNEVRGKVMFLSFSSQEGEREGQSLSQLTPPASITPRQGDPPFPTLPGQGEAPFPPPRQGDPSLPLDRVNHPSSQVGLV